MPSFRFTRFELNRRFRYYALSCALGIYNHRQLNTPFHALALRALTDAIMLFCLLAVSFIMIFAECSICQELLGTSANEHISALLCGHVFHASCIKKWLESSSTCPQCRIMVLGSEKIPRIFFSFIDSSSELCASNQHVDGVRSTSFKYPYTAFFS